MESLAERVEEYHICFRKMAEMWTFFSVGTNDFEKIKRDPLLAIKFFASVAHERAGSNPNFPSYHRKAIDMALEEVGYKKRISTKQFYRMMVFQK